MVTQKSSKRNGEVYFITLEAYILGKVGSIFPNVSMFLSKKSEMVENR